MMRVYVARNNLSRVSIRNLNDWSMTGMCLFGVGKQNARGMFYVLNGHKHGPYTDLMDYISIVRYTLFDLYGFLWPTDSSPVEYRGVDVEPYRNLYVRTFVPKKFKGARRRQMLNDRARNK